MDEFCHSIGIQNATILTSQLASPAPSLAPVTIQCPPETPLYAEKTKNLEDTKKTQDGADDGEKSVIPNDSEEKEGEHESVGESFADELSAYIPKNSVLMRSIRDRKPQGLFVNERYPLGQTISYVKNGMLEDLLADSNSTAGGALIIQDINQEWAENLRSTFPRSAHTTFFAEHMARLDADSITEASLRQLGGEISDICPDARMRGKHFDDERLAVGFDFPFQLPKHKGRHIDFLFQTRRLERFDAEFSFSNGTRQTVYEKNASNHWRRASSRMSWCQLGQQFYLVLVDASPGFDQELNRTALRESPYAILLDPRIDASKSWTQSRLGTHYAEWEVPDDCLRSKIAQLLQYHTVQSLFAPVAVPISETSGVQYADDRTREPSPIWGNRQMILWLLTESSWELAISNLESRWQRARCKVTKLAGDESFLMLTTLRRQVADTEDLITESKEAFTHAVRATGRWIVNGKVVSADQFWSGRSGAPTMAVFRHAQSMDIRNLPDSFERMGERVSAITRAINQEIQVVIGSVQVEDAKSMKRQTEWMVALALLAAIYLPMTLVTGIFGMNISEINADATLPSRWAALKAWGVVFGATLGCILMYAMARRPIKWLLEQREIAKAEAMHVEAQKVGWA